MDGDRFSRTRVLYGDGACRALSSSRALVCGLGAVGGFACEILARMGVGGFLLADCDAFELSNINRQIGALTSTVGRRKTDVQRDRILDINPSASVEVFDGFVDAESVGGLLGWRPDVVVDAIDTISSKSLLALRSAEAGLRLVASMGAARRKDPSKIKTAPISKTFGCPVASAVRKALRRGGAGGEFMCVFSDECACESSHVESGGADSRKIIGSSPEVTAVFGVRLAGLAISELLKDAVR